jgi:acyl-CoA thioesterase YciA
MANDTPPNREPALRTIAMPADANPNGDIFGGWLMAQMDIAGAVAAVRRARGRVATVAVDAMTFHKPVFVGDLVSCYAEVVRVGRSSMTVKIETVVERRATRALEKVTEGTFTYVAIDAQGRPRLVDAGGEISREN